MMNDGVMVGAMGFKNMGGPRISISIRYSLSRVRYSGYSCTILQVYGLSSKLKRIRRPGEDRLYVLALWSISRLSVTNTKHNSVK